MRSNIDIFLLSPNYSIGSYVNALNSVGSKGYGGFLSINNSISDKSPASIGMGVSLCCDRSGFLKIVSADSEATVLLIR